MGKNEIEKGKPLMAQKYIYIAKQRLSDVYGNKFHLHPKGKYTF